MPKTLDEARVPADPWFPPSYVHVIGTSKRIATAWLVATIACVVGLGALICVELKSRRVAHEDAERAHEDADRIIRAMK